jgi:hypothetical protein
VKRERHEADDHSPPTSAGVKIMWAYLYIHSPKCLHDIALNSLSTGTVHFYGVNGNET